MSETTTRGDGVIVGRETAAAGTLPRPGGTGHQGTVPQPPARLPRQRVGQQRRPRPRATVAPPRPAPDRKETERKGNGRPAAAQPAAVRARGSASARMPFIVLLCGLLGGALVSALVISTTLADGSFEISKLQQSDNALARQRQALQEEVAQAQSSPVIERRAYQLGMRPAGQLRFLNLKTGKVETDAGSGEVAAIHVPGYTP